MTDATSSFVTQIKNLTSAQDWPALVQLVKKSRTPDVDSVLRRLDPAHHALAWCLLVDQPQQAVATTQSRITPLLLLGQREQLVHVASEFYRVVARHVATIVKNATGPNAAREALASLQAVERATGLTTLNSHTITPIHPLFLQLVILSKCYKRGVQFLHGDGRRFPIDVHPVTTAVDVLQFFHHAALIDLGMKRYDDALDMLTNCLSVPSASSSSSATTVSVITVSALSKYIITSLILHGHVVPFPPATPSQVHHLYESRSLPAYDALVQAIKDNDNDDNLQEIVSRYGDDYSRDGNAGLVKQLLSLQQSRHILRLTNTHVTLHLDEIAKRARITDAEQAVVKMVADGRLHASIHQKDKVVSFHDDSSSSSSLATLTLLQDAIQDAAYYVRELQVLEHQLERTPSYVAKKLRDNKASSLAGTTTIAAASGPAAPPAAGSSAVQLG